MSLSMVGSPFFFYYTKPIYTYSNFLFDMTKKTNLEMTIKEAKELVDKVMKETRSYIVNELQILRSKSWDDVYDYMHKMEDNIETFVNEKISTVSGLSDISELYFGKIGRELDQLSGGYGPLDGSVPEDIGITLESLSSHYLSKA